MLGDFSDLTLVLRKGLEPGNELSAMTALFVGAGEAYAPATLMWRER